MKFNLLDTIEELYEYNGEFKKFLNSINNEDAIAIEYFVRGLAYGITSFTAEDENVEYDYIDNNAGFITTNYSINLYFKDNIYKWDNLEFEIVKKND